MGSVRGGRRVCLYCILAGFGLMNVALFLHPMSPEDFLAVAFSDPVSTLLDANGRETALFFWGSMTVMLFGLLGFLGQSQFFQRMLQAQKPRSKALFN
jgi:hypothetical protein